MENRRKGQSWHLTTRLIRCFLNLPRHAHNVYKGETSVSPSCVVRTEHDQKLYWNPALTAHRSSNASVSNSS